MKEIPILFSAPMVRALLAGTKTQTRRAVRPLTAYHINNYPGHLEELQHVSGPYGQPGDRLWVREAWKAHTTFDHLPPRDIPESHVWYMADDGYKAESRYRQGMFMPRWASRITLEVTDVRVERLQDISEADAVAEGIERPEEMSREAVEALDVWPTGAERACFNALNQPVHCYRRLWDEINGEGSWAANPWVWAVSFKRITP